MLLILTFAACGDREAEEYDGTTDALGTGELGTEGEMDAASGMATPVVLVSVTGSGSVMPTVPAGPATFTVNNTGAEDCDLTAIPHAGGLYGQDAAIAGQDGTGDTTLGDPETLSGEETAGQSQPGLTGPGAEQGGMRNRVAAHRTSTVTMNLQPGVYELACANAGADGANRQAPQTGDGMLVMVTDAGTMDTGTSTPRTGTGAGAGTGAGTGGTAPGGATPDADGGTGEEPADQ